MFYVMYQLKLELHWWGRFHEKLFLNWIGSLAIWEKSKKHLFNKVDHGVIGFEVLVCVVTYILFLFSFVYCCFVASFGDSSCLLFTVFVFYTDLWWQHDGDLKKMQNLHFPLNFDSHGSLMEMFILF